VKPKAWFESHQIERTYMVTLVDGTEKTHVGTRLEQTADGDTIIWNEGLLVVGYKRSEYKDISLKPD
jgi:hypothetical protein